MLPPSQFLTHREQVKQSTTRPTKEIAGTGRANSRLPMEEKKEGERRSSSMEEGRESGLFPTRVEGILVPVGRGRASMWMVELDRCPVFNFAILFLCSEDFVPTFYHPSILSWYANAIPFVLPVEYSIIELKTVCDICLFLIKIIWITFYCKKSLILLEHYTGHCHCYYYH